MTEEQLSALLRLKRYEQPPAEYFDQLLRDVHHRQRVELLRRPLWRIALDRVQTFFGEHSMSSVSYAGAMAAVLVVGVGAIGLMTPGAGPGIKPTNTANAGGENEIKNPPVNSRAYITLEEPTLAPKLDARSFPTTPVQPQPRYVIDARPVSYEQPSSFRF